MQNNYWYDIELEKKILKFIGKLELDKGKKGRKVVLIEFQKKIICNILCWKNKDGTRRYREAFIFLPRKNGKSFLIALILVFLLFCDDEYGAEYIIAANSRDQAGHLFDMAEHMIQTNPTLLKHCRIIDSRKKIIRKETNSFLQVLSSDSSKADGFNPYICVLDETHEAPNRDLYDKLKTGMGTRKQPLMITISTASSGQDKNNLEYTMYEYAKKVKNGDIQDDTFYSAIYEAEKDCKIDDEKQWYKANPALGIFRNYDEIKALATRAKVMKTQEASFRRLYLNQHIALNDESAINVVLWNDCIEKIDINELKEKHLSWYCGLDMSSTQDITAFVMVAYDKETNKYIVYPHLFTPKNTLLERSQKDNVRYDIWAEQGYLIPLNGGYINFDEMFEYILKLRADFDIKEVAFDRWGSYGIISRFETNGFIEIPMGQGTKTMSPTINDFENILIDKRLIIADNPVLTWMAGNVVAVQDAVGNTRYDKRKCKNKIDGIIAMLMGLNRAIANANKFDINTLYTDESLKKLGW